MRLIISTLFAFMMSSAFGQTPADEHHTTSGSKIWPPSGPVWAAEGPGPAPGHGCVEPTCGGTINKPEPGRGDVTTPSQKEQENKAAKEKAKAYAQTIKNTVVKTMDLFKSLKSWLGLDGIIHYDEAKRTVKPNGEVSVEGACFDMQLDFGADEPRPLPCVEIKGTPEPVKQQNGAVENQLRFTFVIYEACYYEKPKTCGPKHFSFIAGSESELSRLINEVAGENLI